MLIKVDKPVAAAHCAGHLGAKDLHIPLPLLMYGNLKTVPVVPALK